ncbi:MAG TPA: DUF4157 domain-containing protein [Thermoanaerobaculia bacterium]|nr:DUF4157 domain-containing protein [Thermoanaerobaculia bacterium]
MRVLENRPTRRTLSLHAASPRLGLRGAGRPLPGPARRTLEARLGHDFTRVRVHDDAPAHRAAESLGARALASGEHVAFRRGELRPETGAGRRLLAHEVTHVVQQRSPGGPPPGTVQCAPDDDWVKDRDGNLYYATEEAADRRKAALEAQGEYSDYRVVSFERGEKTFWRVEMRGPKEKSPEEKPEEQKPGGTEHAPAEPPESQPAAPPASGPASAPATGTRRVFSLTFDDGPHAAALGTGKNRTEKVLDTLKTKGVKGAFFIQTGVSYRGALPEGKKLVERMHAEGHTVGVHTGGTADHELHPKAHAAGRLESELEAGKKYIEERTGAPPEFVRPPEGAMTGPGVTKADIEAVYRKVSLTNLLWDIQGDDKPTATSLQDLKNKLEGKDKLKGIPDVAAAGWQGSTPAHPKIVVLYHDVRSNTADNVGAVIDHIKKVVKDISGGKNTVNFAPP